MVSLRWRGPMRRCDEELVAALHRQYRGMLLNYALHLTNHDRQWSEDVVRQTLLRAWRHAAKLNGDSGLLRTWLFTVARRVVIDGWRSHPGRGRAIAPTVTHDLTARDEIDRIESSMVVVSALRRLAAEQREAIVETYLRGRTVNEAARMLGVPPGIVKSRIYNAMRTLSQALREQGR